MNALVFPVCIIGAAGAAGVAVSVVSLHFFRHWLRPQTIPASAAVNKPRTIISIGTMVKSAVAELAQDRRSRRSKKIMAVLAMGLFLCGEMATGKMLFALICAVVGTGGMYAYSIRQEKRSRDRINLQLAEALTMIANSVRAGQSLQQALEFLTQESQPPLSFEFSQMVSEMRFGTPLFDALQGFARRVPTADVVMAVNAIHLAKETGGNLAEILTRVASTIAERRKIQGKVNALTAQGRASGMIMSIIPFVLLGLLYAMEPSMIELLFTTFLGNLMLLAVIVMISAGAYMIDKIVNVSV